MKNWYNIEVQMFGGYEMTERLVDEIANALGFSRNDVDEYETYKVVAIFQSDVNTDEMQTAVAKLLESKGTIAYIDMLYRRSDAMLPVRITFWQSGRVQTYKTHVIFDEEE